MVTACNIINCKATGKLEEPNRFFNFFKKILKFENGSYFIFIIIVIITGIYLTKSSAVTKLMHEMHEFECLTHHDTYDRI